MATTGTEPYFSRSGGILLLWIGLLAAPLAWALHLQASYMLGTLACAENPLWAFHLATGIAVLIALVGTGVAWYTWGRAERRWPRGEGGVVGRSRFMALTGFIFSLGIVLVIVAQWLPSFILPASCL